MAKKSTATAAETAKEMTVEEKLRTLFDLQQIDSRIDKIRTLRGELPLEVQDLEDEIAGLDTRIQRQKEEVKKLEGEISAKKTLIKEAGALIAKYEQQQMNVRNNREFDSLSKEIEYQNLEIQLAEKRIKEFKAKIELVNVNIEELESKHEDRNQNLTHKKGELDAIISETQREEQDLLDKSASFEALVEDRYLAAYKRIRSNSFNGLAVVAIERDSCGGCFNKIPPQRQLDIAQHKKIIVCEHCGRVLVDVMLASEEIDKIDDMLK